MMPAPHRDTKLVSVSDQIVGVNGSELETDQTGSLVYGSENPYAWQCRQPLVCQSPEMMIPRFDSRAPNFFQVIQSNSQPNRTGNVRRPGLESVWSRFPFSRFKGDSRDHFAAELVGFQVRQNFGSAVKHADAGWTTAFVARKDQKIALELLNVDRGVPRTLGGIDERSDTVPASDGTDFFHRVDATKRIRDVGESENPYTLLLQ